MNVPCHLTKDAGDPNYCHSPQGTLTYGLGATNTITVIVLDSLIYFYANGTFIDQAKVPASVPPLNYIGVFATGVHTPSDIAFSNFSLWNI
jgi:hypothetical protein